MAAIIHPKSSQHETAGPYSPVIGVTPGAKIFVISGQAPVNDAGDVVGETLEVQARVTLENCLRQLKAAECGFEDVFKATIYLTDLGGWSTFNEVYKEYFSSPFPARTAVEAGLLPGFLVEIEMWAARS